VHRKNKSLGIDCKILNFTAIISVYAGREPQGGTALETFSKFLLSY